MYLNGPSGGGGGASLTIEDKNPFPAAPGFDLFNKYTTGITAPSKGLGSAQKNGENGITIDIFGTGGGGAWGDVNTTGGNGGNGGLYGGGGGGGAASRTGYQPGNGGNGGDGIAILVWL
jgi:hypothetical protein